jgi:hypothetical protein
MSSNSRSYIRALSVTTLLFALGANADVLHPTTTPIPKYYVQLLLGNQPLDESWTVRDDEGNDYIADVDAIRHIGFAVQRTYQSGVLEFGIEGAAFVGYDSDRKLFVRLGSESSVVDIDSSLWTGDFSAGTFIGLKPRPWLRFFIAAGPSIYWGQLSHSDDADDQDGDSTSGRLVIDTRSDDHDIGVALYGRAGVEFIFDNGFVLGASVRKVNTHLDFGRNGRVDIDQPQYSVVIGSYF